MRCCAAALLGGVKLAIGVDKLKWGMIYNCHSNLIFEIIWVKRPYQGKTHFSYSRPRMNRDMSIENFAAAQI